MKAFIEVCCNPGEKITFVLYKLQLVVPDIVLYQVYSFNTYHKQQIPYMLIVEKANSFPILTSYPHTYELVTVKTTIIQFVLPGSTTY